MTTEIKTIDVTPTWSAILPMLIMVLQDGTPQGQAEATAELRRMAQLADRYVAAQQELSALSGG